VKTHTIVECMLLVVVMLAYMMGCESTSSQLFHAAENGNHQKVQVLLDKGVDIHLQDEDNRTPLHLAAWRGHLETVQLLLQEGAKTQIKDNS
jgi:ankyrin repeat protein